VLRRIDFKGRKTKNVSEEAMKEHTGGEGSHQRIMKINMKEESGLNNTAVQAQMNVNICSAARGIKRSTWWKLFEKDG